MVAEYRGVHSWLPAHDSAAARLVKPKLRSKPGVPGPTSWLSRADTVPLPSDQCVPVGRLPFNLQADEVHCYTVMTGEAFAILKGTGSVGPDQAVRAGGSGWEDPFAAAYDWMRWQMHLHLADYGGDFPMWVWARTRRRDLVNTVKSAARHSPGSVLVTLRIPRARLLLTDYVRWHDVLNGIPSFPATCPNCGRPHCNGDWFDPWSDAWDARVPRSDEGDQLPWWSWPPSLQAELFRSWDMVREIGPRCQVQGCVETLPADWVTAANLVA